MATVEQLTNARIIAGVGRGLGASERDVLISLMTALQESWLRNLDFGDKDSLGLFQQRPSMGWGTPAQVTDPWYAAGKFFAALLRISGRDALSLTQAAQAVQRSGFPDAYAKHEPTARAIMEELSRMPNIAGERAALAAQGLVYRPREQWGSRFNYYTDRPVSSPATQMVAHIAVVDDPGDLLGTEDQVTRNIESIGINRFPSTGFSYNAVAFNSGRLYEGQPLTRRGAHTVNTRLRSRCSQSGCPSQGDDISAPSWNNNINARACVAPQMPGDAVTDAQVHAFARWGAALKRSGFVTRDAQWHGHRCFSSKDCPSAQVWARLPEIAKWTEFYTVNGLVEDELPFSEADLSRIIAAAVDATVRQHIEWLARDVRSTGVALSEVGQRQVTAATTPHAEWLARMLQGHEPGSPDQGVVLMPQAVQDLAAAVAAASTPPAEVS